ncbi:MAG: glucose-6-phosphate isomerase, partial [Slackia sp.]|nr:glucose-6-phosphate isomerase [Slackia sp.]
MLISATGKRYPSATTLVRDKVASRLHAKDENLYDFDEAAPRCAKNFTRWGTLARQPPYPHKKIPA